jgi:hypothetical protein
MSGGPDPFIVGAGFPASVRSQRIAVHSNCVQSTLRDVSLATLAL